jgi:mannose-6-phosphate isomerase class I
VIRAGLTPKHVDVNELQHIVDSSVLEHPKIQPGDGSYTGPGGAFDVRRIDLAGSATVSAEYTSIIVRTAGTVDGLRSDEAMALVAGDSIELSGNATLWLCRQH